MQGEKNLVKRLAAVLLIFGLAFLAACGSDEPTTAPPVSLELTATDIAFDTTRFEVMAGQPVRLTLNNEGALTHDFSIMEMPLMGNVMSDEMEEEMPGHDMSSMAVEPEIHVAAAMNSSTTIEFTPSEPGEYTYFCTVAGHKEAGMMGTLVVQAP
ncbi:MAG: multicopper oxidase domain-containing protein [Ardenticatenaceae bacterium]|nr:multicopper oxidase domain-containing protein [Ardenticatenaceae bacterium]